MLDRFLTAQDPAPVAIERGGASSPFLFVCDHAGRAIPARLGDLGLPPEAMDQHVAWDIGALELSRRVSAALRAPLIHQAYSRLVIDCNRDPGRADSIVARSDIWDVPGNVGLSVDAAGDRRRSIFDPYHAAIAAEVDARQALGLPTLLVSLHSFTPFMAGQARPWHVGVLHLGGSAASDRMLDLLRAEPDLVVGDNQPYAMTGVDFTVPHHAHRRGLDAVEIEVRQDILADPRGMTAMAELLLRLIPRLSPPA